MFISVYDVHSVVWRSVFFFFKQKTAYEMRISDWSSDVCSSDLPRRAGLGSAPCPDAAAEPETGRLYQRRLQLRPSIGIAVAGMHADHASLTVEGGAQRRREGQIVQRSEEHTSELQSLMRNSYAVFCLQKQNKTTAQHTSLNHDPHCTHITT